jgi:hypothetical protein
MSAINSLSIPEQHNIFTPNDRQNKNTMLSDFEHLHNTNGNFLDWELNSSLNSNYGHSLFVKQGSIEYASGGFILAQDTILQYNLTNHFPKKNLAVKIKANTRNSRIDVNVGGFHCIINAFVATPDLRVGVINYSLTYEDDTITLLPQLSGFTYFIDSFEQHNDNEYQFFIDHDNKEVTVN